MIKTLLTTISLFLIFTCSSLYAQSVKLSGIVEDQDANPIYGATLVIMAADSSILAYTSSSTEGLFSMKVKPTTDASLSVARLGYQAHLSAITISKDTTLTIVLSPQTEDAGAVTVTAQRPTMEFKDGNMVVNIEQMLNSQTSNLSLLLSKVPGVTSTKQEGVTLYGQGATVYIDGRKQKVDALTLLESYQGSMVDQVELISVSGGQYDAADGMAIMNIITKKRGADGYFASINLTPAYQVDGELSCDNDAVFMFKKKRVMFNTFLRYRNDYSWSQSIDTTLYASGVSVVRDDITKYRSDVGGFSNT